jgi:dTDP-4-amino-4,6-dideoxygalactose transaminase
MGNIALKPRPVGVGTFRLTDRMRNSIVKALESGQISYGPVSRAFEQKFAALHGCKYAILSNSGTSALLVALQALKEVHGWADGDEVIVPATTFVATANIVTHCRMKPVFVDVDPLIYNMNPVLMRKAITARTRACIPVHLFGQPADMSTIKHMADEAGILLIEDSCEAMFVSHAGRPVGSWGAIGCFSTYVAHLLVTGVGGLCTTNDAGYAAKLRSLVNHGLEIKFLNPDQNFAPQPTPGRRFVFDAVGHSFRITEMEAAIGLAQIEGGYEGGVGEMLAVRARNARHYSAGLRIINNAYGDWFQIPLTARGNEHAWMMYPLVLPRGVDKEPLMAWLNERGIETRDMLPILNQPAYSYLDPREYPVSQWLVESGFYVGVHQNLDPDDVQYVLQEIEAWVSRETLERELARREARQAAALSAVKTP